LKQKLLGQPTSRCLLLACPSLCLPLHLSYQFVTVTYLHVLCGQQKTRTREETQSLKRGFYKSVCANNTLSLTEHPVAMVSIFKCNFKGKFHFEDINRNQAAMGGLNNNSIFLRNVLNFLIRSPWSLII
jgi:hypothetical protein